MATYTFSRSIFGTDGTQNVTTADTVNYSITGGGISYGIIVHSASNCTVTVTNQAGGGGTETGTITFSSTGSYSVAWTQLDEKFDSYTVVLSGTVSSAASITAPTASNVTVNNPTGSQTYTATFNLSAAGSGGTLQYAIEKNDSTPDNWTNATSDTQTQFTANFTRSNPAGTIYAQARRSTTDTSSIVSVAGTGYNAPDTSVTVTTAFGTKQFGATATSATLNFGNATQGHTYRLRTYDGGANNGTSIGVTTANASGNFAFTISNTYLPTAQGDTKWFSLYAANPVDGSGTYSYVSGVVNDLWLTRRLATPTLVVSDNDAEGPNVGIILNITNNSTATPNQVVLRQFKNGVLQNSAVTRTWTGNGNYSNNFYQPRNTGNDTYYYNAYLIETNSTSFVPQNNVTAYSNSVSQPSGLNYQPGYKTPETSVTFSSTNNGTTHSWTVSGNNDGITRYRARSGSYTGSVVSSIITGNGTDSSVTGGVGTYYVTGYIPTTSGGDGADDNIGTYTVGAADTTPENFTNLAGNKDPASLSTTYYATFSTTAPGTTEPGTGFAIGTQVVNGTSISVSNGQYRINTGSWTSTAGTVNQNQTVYFRGTSSGSYNTPITHSLTIGTVTKSFTTETPLTAPVVNNSQTIAPTASLTTSCTISLTSSGEGGTLQYSKSLTTTAPTDPADWQSSATVSVTRGNSYYFWARRASGVQDRTNTAIPVNYLLPDTAVSALENVTISSTATSATVTVQDVARSTDEVAVRVNNGSSNLATRSGNGTLTFTGSLPTAGGPPVTYEFFTRRPQSTGGNGTTWYATDDTFTVTRTSGGGGGTPGTNDYGLVVRGPDNSTTVFGPDYRVCNIAVYSTFSLAASATADFACDSAQDTNKVAVIVDTGSRLYNERVTVTRQTNNIRLTNTWTSAVNGDIIAIRIG